ncbi:MAG: hypothetical protein IKS37_07975 [Solobacterium sp.]|jgi:predicted DNA-binding protein (UPF0251 family)|nr:hypothetical protein [Solobacterium sp.]
MKNKKKTYPIRARDFRALCKAYNSQKRWLYALQKEHDLLIKEGCKGDPERIRIEERMAVQIRLLQENLVKTEEILEKVEECCGEEAADTLRQVYIERIPQKTAASHLGISERTLQRRIRTWLEEVL